VVTQPLILGYHAISARWRSQLAVSEHVLGRQLDFLARRGYVGLTLSEAERRRTAGTLPERAAVITFDDGYASTRLAAPILADRGFVGTVFVVTEFVASGRPLSWPGIEQWLAEETRNELQPLSWDELAMLAGDGWEVASHTARHPLLTSVDDVRIEEELRSSRDAIAARFGACNALAYPYGLADVRVADAAARTGYGVACTLTYVHSVDEPLRRPRVAMSTQDTGLRLALHLSPPALRARRSRLAQEARRLRRTRPWLPDVSGV
jgi:peptidoglycan/xylan/chitin deacetylase (PgdA/CDA1 family)